MDLYVYYRVRQENAALLQTQVGSMQSALALEWPVQPALKRRTDELDGVQTWMEIYSHAPQAFITALEKAAEQAGLQRYIDGARHVETFVDLASCA